MSSFSANTSLSLGLSGESKGTNRWVYQGDADMLFDLDVNNLYTSNSSCVSWELGVNGEVVHDKIARSISNIMDEEAKEHIENNFPLKGEIMHR